MKATLKQFTGGRIREQTLGDPDEMCDAEVYCTFTLEDGRETQCKARVKQTTGSAYRDKVIEVYPIEDLPPGTTYDHDDFRERATRYYTEKIMKHGA